MRDVILALDADLVELAGKATMLDGVAARYSDGTAAASAATTAANHASYVGGILNGKIMQMDSTV